MDFGEAFDSAEILITFLGLLAVMPVLFLMTQNITNPEFDMFGAFEVAIYGIVGALMPALIPTLLLAAVIVFLTRFSW